MGKEAAGGKVATQICSRLSSWKIIQVSNMSGSKVYSIHGRSLKLDSKDDIDPYLKELQAMSHVEEIHIGGQHACIRATKQVCILSIV